MFIHIYLYSHNVTAFHCLKLFKIQLLEERILLTTVLVSKMYNCGRINEYTIIKIIHIVR